MKLIVNAFLALALTAAAQAAEGPALVTIRFNQPNLSYQAKVADAVHQALAIKPTTTFEVVDVTTAGQGTRGQEVAQSITAAGAPAAQVTVSSEAGNVANEEVRIFVR